MSHRSTTQPHTHTHTHIGTRTHENADYTKHKLTGDEDRKGEGTNSRKSGIYEESGGWENQKQSGEYVKVCKVEDSHRDKTERCAYYIYSWECLSRTEFFVALCACVCACVLACSTEQGKRAGCFWNVNSCVAGGRMARNLFIFFPIVFVYTFFLQLFVRRIVP